MPLMNMSRRSFSNGVVPVEGKCLTLFIGVVAMATMHVALGKKWLQSAWKNALCIDLMA